MTYLIVARYKSIFTYIHAHQLLPPRLIYQNLIRLADSPQFKNTELHTITRQQVYNIWLSLTRKEWERDAADDFRSAQLLSLGFITPCFSDSLKYDRAKITEVFIDSTFGTNKQGYELYCVLTEYDLVSLPLSYLLLDTRGLREVGKRGTRLTAWLTALRAAGLNPNVVHTDKDFAEVTAASLAFKRNNDRYNHHLCLWHTRTLRGMIKRHLLRHPVLPKPFFDSEGSPAPEGLLYQTYAEIHSSSVKEMLEYCKSIDQPKLFRYFWNNWYRPDFKNVGSRWELASLCGRPGSNATIPISRRQCDWRKDYASRFVKPRLDVLTYIVCTGLVRSRMHLYSQVEAGREKPSAYKDFVHLWRKCAEAINHNAIVSQDEVYHTDEAQWLCSCPSFILNSRYLCKHLVFVVQPPPSYTPQLFQESLPLIRFSQHDIKGPATISSGMDMSDCIDDEVSNDDSTSVSYAEELKSLELVPAEDPEAAEENDENISDSMRVVHWASGPQWNCKLFKLASSYIK
ncbi:hypothetical protein V1506DRAFT_556456 [Lipomyces tetrasporus]